MNQAQKLLVLKKMAENKPTHVIIRIESGYQLIGVVNAGEVDIHPVTKQKNVFTAIGESININFSLDQVEVTGANSISVTYQIGSKPEFADMWQDETA